MRIDWRWPVETSFGEYFLGFVSDATRPIDLVQTALFLEILLRIALHTVRERTNRFRSNVQNVEPLNLIGPNES